MKGALQIGLNAGEKIYMNGAVFSVDRKVRIELLNEATFLLGTHVMQLEDATTPLKKLYFLIQGLLMNPVGAQSLLPNVFASIATLRNCVQREEMRKGLAQIGEMMSKGSTFAALKALRKLLPLENEAFAAERADGRQEAVA